jgi:TRAP-type mannitol/chloroaromatic compound transport system permease large subunit
MDSGILYFALFFFLLFIGVPIAVSVGITSIVFLWLYHLGIYVVSTNVFANIAKFPLLAIPFFILAGFIMDRVGISRGLVKFINLFIGPIPGGLGLVTIIGCVIFGAISGTGPADTAALGAVMIITRALLQPWWHPLPPPMS